MTNYGDGVGPEMGDCFAYRDQKYSFWFYATVDFTRPDYHTVEITSATTGKFRGFAPQIDSNDHGVVEENIRRYFASFDILGREITAANPASNVRFTWKLRA